MREDISKAIVSARPNTEPAKTTDDRECVALGKYGKEVKENSLDTFCKAVRINEGRIKYYVLRGPNKKLFNPYGVDYDDHYRRRKADSITSQFVFVEVNEKTFGFYTKFLDTQNPAWLLNAQREYQ